jgi:hypothetical protein
MGDVSVMELANPTDNFPKKKHGGGFGIVKFCKWLSVKIAGKKLKLKSQAVCG